MDKEGGRMFLGDYSYFIEKEEERMAILAHQAEEQTKSVNKENDYNAFKANQKEIRKLERQKKSWKRKSKQTKSVSMKLNSNLQSQKYSVISKKQTHSMKNLLNSIVKMKNYLKNGQTSKWH